MKSAWTRNSAIIGAAGKNPRVEIMDLVSGQFQTLIDLPEGHSAYALDADWDGGNIAIGTKKGLIYHIKVQQNPGIQNPFTVRKKFMVSPVLTVCLSQGSLLAAGEKSGRCRLWNLKHDTLPKTLEGPEQAICSLLNLNLNLNMNILAGLSLDGNLIFWKLPEGELIRKVEVAEPPSIPALVNIAYWPAMDAIVCPSFEGRLVLYCFEKDTILKINAHEGSFYAISVLNENLVTVGENDGWLKIWEKNTSKPCENIQVRGSVIAIGITEQRPCEIIMVEKNGSAGIYRLESGTLEPTKLFQGKDYRTIIIAPDIEKYQEFYLEKKQREANQIVQKIQEGIDQESENIIENYHSQLIALGFEHVSLALKAERAFNKGDLGESLKNFLALMQILPQDNPKSCCSMENCANLLASIGQLPEAFKIYNRIISINPGYSLSSQAKDIIKIFNQPAIKDFVLEPDIPIREIIQSTIDIEKNFNGRYVLKTLPRNRCKKVKINPRMVVEKYQQILNKNGKKNYPLPKIDCVWWIRKDKSEQVNIVTFKIGPTLKTCDLQFALKILPGETETLIDRFILFKMAKIQKEKFIDNEKIEALKVLDKIENNEMVPFNKSRVFVLLEQTLRQLITEILSKTYHGGFDDV